MTSAGARSRITERDDIHVIAALTAVMFWAVGPILNKTISVGTPTIVLYRTLIGVPLMTASAYRTGGRLSRQLMRDTMVPGILFALSFMTGFASVKMTSVANATLVTTLQPVLVMFVARRMFGERLRPVQVGYSAVSMAGVLVVVLAAASTSGAHLNGDLMALLNVCIWSTYFVLAKKRRLAGVHAGSFLAAAFIWGAMVIVPFGLLASNDLTAVTGPDWLRLVGMAVGPGLIGHSLMTWSQSHLDVTIASVFGLLSPVISTALAWMILDESLTPVQMLGAGVVVVSLTLLVREQRGSMSVPVEPEEI